MNRAFIKLRRCWKAEPSNYKKGGLVGLLIVMCLIAHSYKYLESVERRKPLTLRKGVERGCNPSQ